MTMETYRPGPPLGRFVDHILYFEGSTAAHSVDRFLPDGNTELVIDLNEAPQYIFDNETLQAVQSCTRAWASGIRTGPISIPSGRDNRMLVVAFSRGGAYPFYAMPMTLLSDSVVMADAIWGNQATELRERLLNATDARRMFALVEEALLRLAGDRLWPSDGDACIEFAVRRISLEPLPGGLKALSEMVGYSRKHFIELFKARVGVSPQRFLRILRFQRCLAPLQGGERPDWSALAMDAGYYDQAHLIRDFREFAGFTPSEYLRRLAGDLNYLPMA
jgi:AraC-like DNA-binding protein